MRDVLVDVEMSVDEHEESRESVEDDQHSPFVGYRQEVDALEGHEQRTARGNIEMLLQELEPFDGAQQTSGQILGDAEAVRVEVDFL